jgi:hypothetical protein
MTSVGQGAAPYREAIEALTDVLGHLPAGVC